MFGSLLPAYSLHGPFAIGSWSILLSCTNIAQGKKQRIHWAGVFMLTSGLIVFVLRASEGGSFGECPTALNRCCSDLFQAGQSQELSYTQGYGSEQIFEIY